jgi:hypothetical protein
VRLSREGYRSAERALTLGEGAQGELDVSLEEDSSATARSGARVEPTFSQRQVQVSVDGQRRGVDPVALVLPAGPHTLLFERAGFFPQERALRLAPGAQLALEVFFEPTPELRAQLEERQGLGRRLAVGGLGGGGAALAAGVALTVANASRTGANDAALSSARAFAQTATCAPTRKLCDLATRGAEVEQGNLAQWRWVGPTLLGVGATAAALGLVSWLLAPDPSAYDRAPAASELEPTLSAGLLPGGMQVQLSARF